MTLLVFQCRTIRPGPSLKLLRFLDAQALHARAVCRLGDGRAAHLQVVRRRHTGVAHAHTYQDTVYTCSKLRPGEALHASRAVLWKAAARQLKKIEAERNKPVKKFKVSTRKQYPGVSDVQLSSPRPSACGLHQVCQLSAHVNINGTCYGTCVEDVYYELPPAEGESDKEAKMRVDRHRHREEVALEWLSSMPHMKPSCKSGELRGRVD